MPTAHTARNRQRPRQEATTVPGIPRQMTEDEIFIFAISLGEQCQVKTWLELKKLLLVSLSSNDRRNFSIRDPYTKRQRLNSFEQNLLNSYHQQTGKVLEVENYARTG